MVSTALPCRHHSVRVTAYKSVDFTVDDGTRLTIHSNGLAQLQKDGITRKLHLSRAQLRRLQYAFNSLKKHDWSAVAKRTMIPGKQAAVAVRFCENKKRCVDIQLSAPKKRLRLHRHDAGLRAFAHASSFLATLSTEIEGQGSRVAKFEEPSPYYDYGFEIE